MIKEIEVHLNSKDLDFRKANGIKFFDQKITPDVLYVITDCILNLVADRENYEFTWRDIYESKYFNDNVISIFKKPNPNNKKAKNEYDKFIGQPLVLLGYLGLLINNKVKGKNVYTICDKKIIQYISYKERNAYLFLDKYIEKVLSDSGQIKHFEIFQNNNTKIGFDNLRNQFIKFFIGNSNLGSRGSKNPSVEVRRIFNKILNIYAYSNSMKGVLKGNLSKNEIGYYDLMYNKPNWRDINKEKRVTRNDAKITEKENIEFEKANAYSDYQVQKVMNIIRKLYTESEVRDQWANGDATQIHHIFPKSRFPQLAHYLENLIKLTPTQHYTKAHPNNKTDTINLDYQLVCLLAKSDNIEKSINNGEFIYRKESFIYCINTGLTKELKLDLTFRQIKTELVTIYNDL